MFEQLKNGNGVGYTWEVAAASAISNVEPIVSLADMEVADKVIMDFETATRYFNAKESGCAFVNKY